MPSYESVNARRENPNSSHRKRNKRTQYVEVLRFDYDGKYHSTLYINKDICEKHGLNYSSVMNALNPNSKNSVSYKGFIWIRKRDFSEEELARRIARRKAKKTLKQLGESKSKQIIQIDIETKDGEFLTVNCPCCDPSSRKGKLIKNKYYVKPMYVVDVQVRLGLRLNDDYQKSTKISIRGDLYDSDYSWNYYSVELSQDGKDYATRTYSRKDIYLSEDECKKAVEEKQQKESD